MTAAGCLGTDAGTSRLALLVPAPHDKIGSWGGGGAVSFTSASPLVRQVAHHITASPSPSSSFSFFFLFFSFLFFFFIATLVAYGISLARGQMGTVIAAAGLRHSHSNAGSEPDLRSMPQLAAMLDP